MKKRVIFSLMMTLVLINLPAQTRTVTGIVSDSQGSPISGVTVIVKGTSTGVLTDARGWYSIGVHAPKSVLVFSFIGMKTLEMNTEGKSVVNVVLEAETFSLDEVITVGYNSNHKLIAPAISGRVAGVSLRGRYNRESIPQWNTEGYATVHENGFRDVRNAPLSTFSIDVDNASWSNVRRFLNSGQLPPVDAVRIEEMINYFTYNYPEPEGTHPFSVTTAVATCPWNEKNLLMHIGLKGRSIDKGELPASNIVFLIDVSGSMDMPNKLPLLKSSFSLLVNELRPSDRVAIVVYAGAAGLVLESTPGNRKEVILSALDRLEAGGSTAGGAGLQLAYQVAERHFIEGGNNRIILATDGDFNVGSSSNAEMERLVEKEREKGVFMTVLGFGMGNYKDDKMEIIANKGNGNYAYIDNIQEARRVLVKEFGGTLFTIAKDVKFQVEFNPASVHSYRLIGYENRLLNDEDFNDDKKDAGEMGSGHTVTALYEIVPAGRGSAVAAVDPLKYQKPASGLTGPADELATIKMRYKEPMGLKSRLFDEVVRSSEKSFVRSSEDLRFAASVAGFGMLLRNSEFKGELTYRMVLEMANGSRGEDADGYRAEFIRLVSAASGMSVPRH